MLSIRFGLSQGRHLGKAFFILLFAAVLLSSCQAATAPPGAVHVIEAKGQIGPVMHRYIDRVMDRAEASRAVAAVILLDTPGGLSSSMDEIVKRIIGANVPVVVYVWPPGGRAASAGTFIAMAAHIAAMAPGTSIGAASPVPIGGEEVDETLRDKATNDAAARIRDIAIMRGRNPDWAEQAVRQAAAAGAQEALELKVIEYVSPDLITLLRQIEGYQITLADGRTVILHTLGAPIVEARMSLPERILDVIGDPNIALLLLSLGSLALLYELISPGAIFPGVFGLIAIIVGFYALSVIPFTWTGLALILVGLALLVLEVFVTSHGILALGGITSLVLGALFLTPANPGFAGPSIEVNRWLAYGLGGGLGLFFLTVMVNVIRARRQPAVVGAETLIGQKGVARSPLDPKGFVMVGGEYWQAEVEEGEVHPGDEVIVTGRQGLILKVRKKEGGI